MRQIIASNRCIGSNAPAMQTLDDPTPATTKASELKAFLFLTLLMAPLIAVAVVGTYGLLVWIYQVVMGPPTG